jgi:RNA-directed DNA polymerase
MTEEAIQMNRDNPESGGKTPTMEAPSPVTAAQDREEDGWSGVDWKAAHQEVQRLQGRIFRAAQREQWRKVRALQKLLLRSHSNLLLSVRHVTQVNAGRRTPGVDGKVALSSKERWRLALSIRSTGQHRVCPVRRVYIPKANGKQRPLGIPTIEDRVRQHIVKTALEPAWEAHFEPASYGFRPGRSAHDAIERLFLRLNAARPSKWVLDADIHAAFDSISHDYILKRLGNFPMRRQIERWLKAGYMEQGRFFVTESGTPQGGIVSPLLANIALDGLEGVLGRHRNAHDRQWAYFGYVRYADDFVVTSPSKERLEAAIPEIRDWLAERGLELNEEKTRVVHIDDGFDFLGFNLRRYKGHLLIRPQKDKVLAKAREWRAWIRQHLHVRADEVIRHLNPEIRGWANYYRHVVSSEVYGYMDGRIAQSIWRWALRRHPTKTRQWVLRRYFGPHGNRRRVFSGVATDRHGRTIALRLASARTPIYRHVVVKGANSPMDPMLRDYWFRRNKARGLAQNRDHSWTKAVGNRTGWICTVCRQPLYNGEPVDEHHFTRVVDGGSNHPDNVEMRHEACHYNAHGRR